MVGFCLAAVVMAVWAAAMLSCSVGRIFMWITATFNGVASFVYGIGLSVHLNVADLRVTIVI